MPPLAEQMLVFQIDLRCITVTVTISVVFLFYLLLNQYDASVFNPMNGPHDLQRFIAISSNKMTSPHIHSINNPAAVAPIHIADRSNSPYVVVGYCCQEPPGIYERCKPQKFVTDIAEGTFLAIKKVIIYQQCTRKGTPPLFMINPYLSRQETEQEMQHLPKNVTKTTQIWYKPDILLCQGWFYHKDLIAHRQHLSRAQSITVDIGQQMKLYHHLDVPYDADNYDQNQLVRYNDNLKYSIRLSRQHNKLWQHYNRSFLTTYNTEFWGGGQCKRYDIAFESVFDRTLHGCVAVYVPPAFYFESDRMFNDTEQLILPQNVVFNGGPFTMKQKEYIDSILAFKEPDKFALFLVRDCYKSKYHIDAVLRPIFFDLLSSEYKEVTALGGCRRNKKVHKELGWSYCPKNSFNGDYWDGYKRYNYNCSGYGWTDGVVQMARSYKFFITFENSKIKGYSTEKIFNALYSNAVPIYFGDPMITQYVNPNKFIHCNTISDRKIQEMRKVDRNLELPQLIEIVKPMIVEDMLQCVEKVKKVDQNETLYHQMLLEPVFVNNTYRNTVMDPQVIGHKLRYALNLHNSYLVKHVQFEN